MGQFLYERPREKLVRQGVASLRTTELLQVLIGSGTTGEPVQRLARRVGRLLLKKRGTVALGDVLAIKGIGPAKAGLIIAALELSTRFTGRANGAVYTNEQEISHLLAHSTPGRDHEVTIYLFDGADRSLDTVSFRLTGDKHGHSIAAMVRAVIDHGAAGVYVVFAQRSRSFELSLAELSLVRNFIRACSLLSVKGKGCAVVTEEGIVPQTLEEVTHVP